MLSRIAQRRLAPLLSATRPPGRIHPLFPKSIRPGPVQSRNVAFVPGNSPNNMGGPGGQEHFPESTFLRRRYTMTTMCGVLAACSVLMAAKVAKMKDPNESYVLVHDASKGELDDVKYVKKSDLPKL